MNEPAKNGASPIKRPHSLHLEGNARLTIGGVISVKNYNDKEVTLALCEYILCVGGENLNMDKLDIDDGAVVIEGLILNLRYLKSAEKGGFLKRLAK
ncbi:MAG: YabP/YqfC family sporulation protein [Clostridiales bacterium]|jgi:sporulation protein YabP|nr:YabP/YqfC family sporulation protein [Clostridiales bacterium]